MHIIIKFIKVLQAALLITMTTALSLFTSFTSSHAAIQPIKIQYLQQVRLDIASDAVNRISFGNGRVIKLIGETNGFDSILSDRGSDLFISSRLPAGSKIDFSSILASGDIIDFSLNIVESKTPSLIQLKFPSDNTSSNTNNNTSSTATAKSEAIKMIEAMRTGELGKYYIQQPLKKINVPVDSKITVTAQDNYRFGNLHGVALTLQNTDRTLTQNITANTLAASFEFRRVAAIALERELLLPKQKTVAYIVFKGALK